ncbi:MAG: hypothetical protein U9Q81_04135 [Pseudomonadota bacterium]|nr:hypothetical protein [Pseudomonadota bacterium]
MASRLTRLTEVVFAEFRQVRKRDVVRVVPNAFEDLPDFRYVTRVVALLILVKPGPHTFPTRCCIDLRTGEMGYRTYEDSLNPPILHRKELLLPEDHPRRTEYAALTQAAETIGLFDEPTRTGYRRQWEQLVREKGSETIVRRKLLDLRG